ncbi:hypothetical protein OQJ13_10455 [Legionella sp. PATHC035]|uniref:hypothetical protein n=1 Tax=Legionella sp. PATHC035 TaxID=2992040 RepID=UPI002243DEF5|nr:hypothetical protein [Legionella sp. PATHC035]MCW8409395.1 hypothetical protein [Legionella sp. PATHC035]
MMRFLYEAKGITTKTSQTTRMIQSQQQTRSIFTAKNAAAAPMYDNHLQGVPLIISNLKFFTDTTFRGKPIGKDFLSAVWNESGFKLGFRGMSLSELMKKESRAMLGMVGKKEIVAYKSDGTRDLVQTKANLADHASDTAKVHGISVSDSIFVGFKFSSFLLPSTKTVVVVDYTNIPEDQQFSPLAEQSDTTPSYSPQGEPAVYTNEYERTISNVPAWAILMKITRDGFTFNVDLNPLYVDRAILSPQLQEDFDNLTEEFYKACRVVRDEIDHPDVREYRKSLHKFYENYAIEAKLGSKQIQAIKENLEQYGMGIEDTPDTTVTTP